MRRQEGSEARPALDSAAGGRKLSRDERKERAMFEGFEIRDVETAETTIHVRTGGAGPPLLLLHGYPQSHVDVAPGGAALAERFSVVCPDLRGYGDSGKPASDPEHAVYSKRSTARRHGRRSWRRSAMSASRSPATTAAAGSRHRLALDHPARVEKLAVLDIVADPHDLPRDRPGDRDRLLSLVLPDPARRPARAPDRRRPGLLSALGARRAGARRSMRSRPRRSPSTSAASRIRR